MGIIFSEGSGLNDSIYGNCQAPIRMFLEQRAEQFEQNSVLNDLFLVGQSENFGDLLTTMTAMNGFKPVGENGAYPGDSMQEGFSKFMKYQTWKDSFAISQEMIENAKLMDMRKQPAAFMTAYQRTRERFGAAVYAGALNQAKSISFEGVSFDTTSADGQPVFSTEHHSAIDPKDKQCNCFSDEFSADALGRMETAMHLFRGDNRNILDVAPSVILIPEDADLKQKVFAAIGADKDPTTANNAFNYQYGRWTVIIWSYLNEFITKKGAKPWVLLDPEYNQNYGGAVWTDRITLAVRSSIDENTDANIWRGRSRFNAAFNDWRFAAVGGVSGGKSLTE